MTLILFEHQLLLQNKRATHKIIFISAGCVSVDGGCCVTEGTGGQEGTCHAAALWDQPRRHRRHRGAREEQPWTQDQPSALWEEMKA